MLPVWDTPPMAASPFVPPAVVLLALAVLSAAIWGPRLLRPGARTARMARIARRPSRAGPWRRRLADTSFDGLLIHQSGIILQMNNALLRMLGCREREWIGQNFANLARPDQAALFRATLAAPSPQISTFWLRRPDNTELAVEIFSHTLEYARRLVTVTAIRDISRRLADAEEIARLRDHDPLTGLANRRLFTETLATAITESDAKGGSAAVLMIDFDHFKQINEEIGRANGDDLLCQAARRITSLLAAGDLLARLSGDKFGVMLRGLQSAQRAVELATQLEGAFGNAFMTNGKLVRLSLSIGIASYPEHAATAEGLLKASDFAQAQAQRAGGGFCHIFSQEEANRFRWAAPKDVSRLGRTESQRLSQDLRVAVVANEIGLVYQPIFRTADLSLVGFEALARWHHRDDGPIAPSVFIPLAEQAGLIHEIGGFVLETACTEAVLRPRHLKMAVNLSPLQFRDVNLTGKIAAILRKTGLAPDQLEVEVTESLLIEDGSAAAYALKALRNIGVRVALDDFGTGYSSLGYLCDYPFSRLKIDKRFVQALGQDANADAVVMAILSLARNLRLDVTAEGVETAAQLTFLRQAGCQQVQGYLLGRPGIGAVLETPSLSFPPARQLLSNPTH